MQIQMTYRLNGEKGLLIMDLIRERVNARWRLDLLKEELARRERAFIEEHNIHEPGCAGPVHLWQLESPLLLADAYDGFAEQNKGLLEDLEQAMENLQIIDMQIILRGLRMIPTTEDGTPMEDCDKRISNRKRTIELMLKMLP